MREMLLEKDVCKMERDRNTNTILFYTRHITELVQIVPDVLLIFCLDR